MKIKKKYKSGVYIKYAHQNLRYNSFEELFEDFDIEIMADKSMTKQELLNVLDEFYTPEKQKQYGVVGIRIEKI